MFIFPFPSNKKRLLLSVPTGLLVVLAMLTIDVSTSSAVKCIDILRQTLPKTYTNPKNCIKCHEKIYRAWGKSRHAMAWTSRTFIDASENRTKQKCLPCHVPSEMTKGERPAPRTNYRHDGIYCIPCHLTREEMRAPPDMSVLPNSRIKFNSGHKSFQEPKFCGSCHLKTFNEWKASGVTEKCQSCHMMTKKKPSDHQFPFIKINGNDIVLKAGLYKKEIVVSLLNRTIPHHFPTADNGDPRVYLYVKLYDKQGEEIDSFKELLSPQRDTALEFGRKIRFIYDWTEEAKRIEISLKYKASWSKFKKEIRRIRL